MIPEIRTAYNAAFTPAKYEAFLQDLYSQFNHIPGFRIAETPVFIPRSIREQIFEACNQITDDIVKPGFKELTEPSLTDALRVPNEDAHTTFLQMDFGLVEGENGEVVPRMIEVQGFPSLYFYQHYLRVARSISMHRLMLLMEVESSSRKRWARKIRLRRN